METEVCEKFDIARIMIQRVQGSPSNARVSSIEAANRVLNSWADRAPDFGHEQCHFQIVFEDGFRYQGHFQLSKTAKRNSLAGHIRKQLTALAKEKDIATLAMTKELPFISLIGDDLAESARIALDHYNI